MKTKQRWFLTSVSLLTICFVLFASSPLAFAADSTVISGGYNFNSPSIVTIPGEYSTNNTFSLYWSNVSVNFYTTSDYRSFSAMSLVADYPHDIYEMVLYLYFDNVHVYTWHWDEGFTNQVGLWVDSKYSSLYFPEQSVDSSAFVDWLNTAGYFIPNFVPSIPVSVPQRYYSFHNNVSKPSDTLLSKLTDSNGLSWGAFSLEGHLFSGRIRAVFTSELPGTVDVSGWIIQFLRDTGWVNGFGIFAGTTIGGSNTDWYIENTMHWDFDPSVALDMDSDLVSWLGENGLFSTRPLVIPTPDINFDNIFDDGVLGGAYAYYSSMLGDFIKEQPLLVTYFVLLCGMILLSFVVFGKR